MFVFSLSASCCLRSMPLMRAKHTKSESEVAVAFSQPAYQFDADDAPIRAIMSRNAPCGVHVQGKQVVQMSTQCQPSSRKKRRCGRIECAETM